MNNNLSHSFSSPAKSQHPNNVKSFSKIPSLKCSSLLLLLLFCILPIALSLSAQVSSDHELSSYHVTHSEYHIRKPISDPNEYRYTTLNNGLKVLMISDTTVRKSSAALILDVGKDSDPPEIPGLAHLLEHILVIGSKTENQKTYRNQVDAGGIIDTSSTAYYCDAKPSRFEKILDIFADPFINPRFDFEWYESQVHEIDQEFKTNLGRPDMRYFMLLRYFVDPDSLLVRDTTGNFETLHQTPMKQGINVSQALQDLFEKYHSPNLMTLVIMHDKPLDEIQRVVNESLLAKIPNKNRTKPNLDHFPLPLSDKNRYKILKYSSHTAEGLMIFQVCGVESKLGALAFLKNILIQPHTGSLSSELLERNLISSTITANYFTINSYCGLIDIAFPLTPLGQYRFGEIVQTVFAYIYQLLHKGLTEDLLNEYLHKRNYFFQYSEDPLEDFKNPSEDAKKFANFALNLIKYSPSDFLSKFRGLPDDVHQILSQAKSILLQMNTHNLMLFRSQTQDKEFDRLKAYDPVTQIEYLTP